jgi:hypothetical protein
MWNRLVFLGLMMASLAFPLTLTAQSEANPDQEKLGLQGPDSSRIGLSFVPQHLFKRGLRIDLEYWFPNARSSIVVAPIYYGGSLENDQDGIPEDELMGYGADLIHKIYLSKQKETNESNFYLGHGPSWRRFQVDFQIREWIARQEGDLTLYERGLTDQTRTIQRYGYNFMLGVILAQSEGFMVDLYFGGGIRVTDTRTTQPIEAKPNRSYENSIVDYGYNGPVPVIGFKIGTHL